MSEILAQLSQRSYKRLQHDMRLLSLSQEQKKQLFQRTLWRMKEKDKKFGGAYNGGI